MKLSDYKALTFDCYGTLVDFDVYKPEDNLR